MKTETLIKNEEKTKLVKEDADKIAEFFGYNIHPLSLEVINVKDAYCRGFYNCYQEMKATNEALLSALKKCYPYMHDLEQENFNDRNAGIFKEEHLTIAFEALNEAIKNAEL